MKLAGNIIWLIFGGFVISLEYFISSILLMITVIGIPFSFQTLKLASLALWPFGRTTVIDHKYSGCVVAIMNILWLLFGGLCIALTHLLFGFLLFITIFGIPFARQHFKLVMVALSPFGREIVDF